MVTALTRTFGFELEVAGNADDVALALHRAGLAEGEHQHYYHCSCRECRGSFGEAGNWLKVQNDSSCGGEIISSPLQWGWTTDRIEGWREIAPTQLMRGLTEVLRTQDVTIDEHCGLHVHVGARDLTDRSLGRLYELVHHYEAVLYRLACGRSQQHRGYNNGFTYCRPLSAFENPIEAAQLGKLKSAEVKTSTIAKNKYVVANLVPVDTLGTVEFRLYESTWSLLRLVLYTKLSVALVERARKRAAPRGRALSLGQVGDDGDLLNFLSDLQEHVPELVDDRLVDEAVWQWSCLADWQPAANLRPLRYFDRFGIMLTEETAARVEAHGGPAYYTDSHGANHDIEITTEQRRAVCDDQSCRHCVYEREVLDQQRRYDEERRQRVAARRPVPRPTVNPAPPLWQTDEMPVRYISYDELNDLAADLSQPLAEFMEDPGDGED